MAFCKGLLVLTTLEVITKTEWLFAFDNILPLQSILRFNVGVSSNKAYMLQCTCYCCGVVDSAAIYK